MAFDMIQTFLTFINSYLSFWFLSLLICSFTSLSSHLMQTPGTQCVNPNVNTVLQFCLLQAIGADGQIVEMNMVHTFPANEGSRQLHFVCSVINWAQLWDCTAAIMPSHNPLPLHFARMERNYTFLYVERTVELCCDLLHAVNVRCHRGGEWARCNCLWYAWLVNGNPRSPAEIESDLGLSLEPDESFSMFPVKRYLLWWTASFLEPDAARRREYMNDDERDQ